MTPGEHRSATVLLGGSQPRGRSRWSEYGWGDTVTCPRCLQRLARRNAAGTQQEALSLLPLLVVVPWASLPEVESRIVAQIVLILLVLSLILLWRRFARSVSEASQTEVMPPSSQVDPPAPRRAVSVPAEWGAMKYTQPVIRAQRDRGRRG